jgi:hypothetical protein
MLEKDLFPGGFDAAGRELERKPGDEHQKAVRQGLKLAVAAFFAGRAHVVALDEEHLDQGLPHVLEVRDVVFDSHPVRHRLGAGGHVAAADADGADAAGAGRLKSLPAAEGRDVDPVVFGRLKNGLAGRRRAFLAVDGE